MIPIRSASRRWNRSRAASTTARTSSRSGGRSSLQRPTGARTKSVPRPTEPRGLQATTPKPAPAYTWNSSKNPNPYWVAGPPWMLSSSGTRSSPGGQQHPGIEVDAVVLDDEVLGVDQTCRRPEVGVERGERPSPRRPPTSAARRGRWRDVATSAIADAVATGGHPRDHASPPATGVHEPSGCTATTRLPCPILDDGRGTRPRRSHCGPAGLTVGAADAEVAIEVGGEPDRAGLASSRHTPGRPGDSPHGSGMPDQVQPPVGASSESLAPPARPRTSGDRVATGDGHLPGLDPGSM